MFGFGKKKTISIEEESAKLDSILHYLDTESQSIYKLILETIPNEQDRIAMSQNRSVVYRTYGEHATELLKSTDEKLQLKFMQFFQSIGANYQNKMHKMIGSSIILLFLRSGGAEDVTVFEKCVMELLEELNIVYDNQ